jgi:DNA repair protein RecN (Recombination protein N)
MLLQLTIRNFAIIDQLELEFKSGLTTLTGETGAGKSILIGAIGLVLGDRADSTGIKQGADFAEIVAEFDIHNNSAITSWLVEQELNIDNECILRRRISRDGRSRAYINATPINLQLMRDLGEMLIDIHGQHEHQSMMKPAVQRQLLDGYAEHNDLLQNVSDAYVQLKLIGEQLQHIQKSSRDRSNRIDLLRFQTHELETLALEKNELNELNERHARLAHADRIVNVVDQSFDKLYYNEESNLYSELSKVVTSLEGITEIDQKLSPITNLLQEALIQLEESASQLRLYYDSLELDPSQLEIVEQRIQDILDVARKHRIDPDDLFEFQKQLINELNNLDFSDERLQKLQNDYTALEQTYQQAADALFSSRKKAAKDLDKKITSAMQKLGMRGGKFQINVTLDDKNRRSAHGSNHIEFTVAANPGQECKPLSRVASGGELARISLAIQMIAARQGKIPTLIFDEVDSGVGGSIAEVVGQHLRELGNENQVICITHLPQVASQAHHHMKVHKQSRKRQTQTQVDPLDRKQRIAEIARMLSGVDVTQQSLAHAEEMISRLHMQEK